MANLERLEKLGGHVAQMLDGALPARNLALADARRAFLQRELGVTARARSPWLERPALVAAVAVVATAVSVFVLKNEAPLTFRAEGKAGAVKAWLAASPAAPMPLDFSDGTAVSLGAAARARVVDIDHSGASISLESGALHADVVHKKAAAWRVVAGPFTVSVTGTVFDVNWDPSSEQLRVSVSRGGVSVREAGTSSDQPVQAGETLRAKASQHRFELSRNADASALEAAGGAQPAVPETPERALIGAYPTRAAVSPVEGREVPTSVGAAVPSPWRALAKRGALREAFASADATGFTATCSGATAAELLLLGDGARLSGKADRASEALLTLRRRFPNDPRRGAAAFSLGKVAFDQRGAYEQAASWFATSLREQPSGPLAREASGRLIEALRRADDSAGARRAARDYLSRYPEGPHADLARSILR